MKLLLVDGDPRVGAALARRLAAPAQLRQARTLNEALTIATEWTPSILLLDATLVGQSSAATIASIQRTSKEDIPVLLNDAPARDGSNRPPVPLDGKVERWRAVLDSHATNNSARGLASALDKRAPRLLIVDDDPASVHAMHGVLAVLGAEVLFATRGDEALLLASERQPDLVLLDVQMPGVDGFEVCRRIRAKIPNASILFITRYANAGAEARALDLGGVDFVTKPFSPNVLLARIQRVLRTNEERRAAIRAEREHWQSVGDARVAQIVEHASDAILSCDVHGRIVLANQAASRLLGRTVSELMGSPVSALYARDARAPGDLAEGERVVFERRDGSTVPLEVSVSSQGSEHDKVVTLILRDLSLRDRAEQAERERVAAEAASRGKSMMLSYLAHEISTPLQSLVGFGQLLESDEQYPLPARQREWLALMMAGVHHLRALMRDVLDLSAFEAGQLSMKPSLVDVGVTLREVCEAWANEAISRGLKLVCRGATRNALYVYVDPMRLNQCLINLVSNAIKYSHSGNSVEITARRVEGHVQIEVRDYGVGMSEQQVSALFEPFNRQGKEGMGTGIGLLFTRELITGMGGQLEVKSTPGEGSTFTLSFRTETPTSLAPRADAETNR